MRGRIRANSHETGLQPAIRRTARKNTLTSTYLDDADAYSFEQFVPEWLKPYVKIDTELMARDFEIELYVVEAADGGVMVFDPRV